MLRARSAGGITAVLLLLGLAPPAFVHPARAGLTLAARILDATTREPLADVSVLAGSAAAATGADGRFTLAVARDTMLVTVRRIGYRPVVFAAGALPAEILLQRAPVVLTCLDVTASGAAECRVGRGTLLALSSTPRATLAKYSAPALAEAMETTEGISTSRPGSWGSKSYLRGLGGERVTVLLDGDRINRACAVGMDAGLATIDPDNVERVEVLSGPGSTLYGSGNVGGVINVVTRGPSTAAPLEGELRLSASSAVPGARAGGTLWARRNGFALTASADGASYGDQETPRGTIPGSSFKDATIDVTGSYGPGSPHRLDARVQRYAGRDIGYPGSGNAFIPEEDRWLASLDYGWQASGRLLDGVNAKAYLQTIDHHMTMSMVMPAMTPGGDPMRSATDARSSSDTWGARAQARLVPAPAVHLDAGVEGTQWNAEATRWVERQRMGTVTTTVFHTWPGVRVADLGAFAQSALAVSTWLDASAGGRLDRVLRRADGFESTEEWVGSGNLGLRASTAGGLFVRLGAGAGYRVPDPTELYGLLLRPDGYVYRGDPGLSTETSRSVEVSAGWSGSRGRASVTVYRNQIHDYISTVLAGDSVSGVPVREYRNVADARIDGLTGASSYDAARWLSLRGTAAVTRGENRGTGAPLPAIAPFEATGAARLTPGDAWPWIEPEVMAAARQGRAATAQGEIETPGFVVVNLRAGRAFGPTSLTAGVENLLDAAYRRHLDPRTLLRPGRNAFVKLSQRF